MMIGTFATSLAITIAIRTLNLISQTSNMIAIETENLDGWMLTRIRDSPPYKTNELIQMLKVLQQYTYISWQNDLFKILRYKGLIHKLSYEMQLSVEASHSLEFFSQFPYIFDDLTMEHTRELISGMKCNL